MLGPLERRNHYRRTTIRQKRLILSIALPCNVDSKIVIENRRNTMRILHLCQKSSALRILHTGIETQPRDERLRVEIPRH